MGTLLTPQCETGCFLEFCLEACHVEDTCCLLHSADTSEEKEEYCRGRGMWFYDWAIRANPGLALHVGIDLQDMSPHGHLDGWS